MPLETSPESPAPVRQIANAIAGWIGRLGGVWVEGQVTQISRRPGVNTVFLTLRDPVADISMPLTCSRVLHDSMDPPLVEGARVVVHGRPSYYPNRGTLSLAVREIRPVGAGELLARIERRRRLLAAEGLFAAEHKRPLPFLPAVVGLITAPDSAAERDVTFNASRRWPGVRFAPRYAAMQGQRAAVEVIEALRRLDSDPTVEVIVIARGGGSVEDLLPFSDETLLRVVHSLSTPVVSAIGHEPDSPLLDLVADVRASTPTKAAELIVPDVAEQYRVLDAARERLHRALGHRIERERAALQALRARPVLSDPHRLLGAHAEELAAYTWAARRLLRHRLDRATDDTAHLLARVRAVSPLATLQRGYAVALDVDGRVITSAQTLAAGDELLVRLGDGTVTTRVLRTTPIDGGTE